MGGVRSPYLHKFTRDIWTFCGKINLYIHASYISSRENKIADAKFIRLHSDTEWELTDEAFESKVNNFGNPEIDLFATRPNTKFHKYVSWHRDPGAFVVNAFTLNWNNLDFYAFPPFSVAAKTLRKTSLTAQGIIVAPYWSTQAWFPLFIKLLLPGPVIPEPTDKVLTSVPNRTTT